MTVAILCLVAVCLLAWVIVIKAENDELKGKNKKLSSELERLVRKTTGNANVGLGSQSWGKAKDEMAQHQVRSEMPTLIRRQK